MKTSSKSLLAVAGTAAVAAILAAYEFSERAYESDVKTACENLVSEWSLENEAYFETMVVKSFIMSGATSRFVPRNRLFGSPKCLVSAQNWFVDFTPEIGRVMEYANAKAKFSAEYEEKQQKMRKEFESASGR